MFDPSCQGGFDLDAPPAPWISLGSLQGFTRTNTGKSGAVMTGIPAAALEQVRETLDAEVSFQFVNWTKLTMALATGSQHMNLLAPANDENLVAMGGQAEPGSCGSRRVDKHIDCARTGRCRDVSARHHRRH